MLLGGILTDAVSWEWIFFINVPIALTCAALSPVLLKESRIDGMTRNFDVAGAVSVTGGLSLFVYALVGTDQHGWTSARTLGLFAVAIGLLIAFVAIESRASQPLLPLRLFRSGTVTGANVVGFLIGASIFSMFFFLSLYMQEVLGYSPLRTGFAYLLVAVTIIISAGASQVLVTRFGPRSVLATGMALLSLGLLWFTQVSVGGSYLVDLVPGFVLTGVGLGFSFVPDTIAALAGVRERDAGVASGLINTSQQIGGALGVAALVTVATTTTSDHLADAGIRAQQPLVQLSAATDGFQAAFLWCAVMAAIGIVATLVLVRPPADAGGGGRARPQRGVARRMMVGPGSPGPPSRSPRSVAGAAVVRLRPLAGLPPAGQVERRMELLDHLLGHQLAAGRREVDAVGLAHQLELAVGVGQVVRVAAVRPLEQVVGVDA